MISSMAGVYGLGAKRFTVPRSSRKSVLRRRLTGNYDLTASGRRDLSGGVKTDLRLAGTDARRGQQLGHAGARRRGRRGLLAQQSRVRGSLKSNAYHGRILA